MIVNTTTLARLLCVSTRRIGQLVESGCPKEGPGRFDLERVLPWFLRQQKRTPADLAGEKTRLTKAQADRQELRHAIETGEVIHTERVMAQWAEHIMAARARLLSLPTKLSPQLVNQKNPAVVAAALKKEVYDALDELARWKPNKAAR